MTAMGTDPDIRPALWDSAAHDASCYAALFAEITGDAFPLGPGAGLGEFKVREPGADEPATQWSRQDAMDAAASVLALFAGAVACGDHGPGCPERAEHDAELAAIRASKAAKATQDAHA